MRSYVELIIDPATNNVAYGGALSPYTHNASTEHFKTSSKLLKQRVLEGLEYLSMRNFNWEIKTLLSKVFCLGFRNTPPLGSRSLKHLWYLSHGGGYPRWTHIHLVQFKLFILFYLYGFGIVFEDKPSAVLTSQPSTNVIKSLNQFNSSSP